MILRFIPIPILLCSVAPGVWAGAANCVVGGTTIFFGNGVNVSADGAIASMLDLANSVGSAVNNSNAYDHSCFTYKLSYDSTFVDPSTSCGAFFNMPSLNGVNCGNALNIVVQAGVIASAQVVSQPGFVSQVSAFLYNPLGAPSWLLNALGLIVTKEAFVFAPDVVSHVAAYNKEIANGNVAIVVAHSQGNLYANQAYGQIVPSPATSSPVNFTIVSVATPANTVAGDICPGQQCPYVTLDNDIIITSIPGSLPPNIANTGQPGDPCATPEVPCHFFDTSYLSGINSGPQIVKDVISAIPVPVGVTRTGSGDGSVMSVPAGIDCSDTQLSCIAAFSLGNVTLTATPNAGYSVSKWTGTCAAIGTASGNTVTFPVVNTLPSFPEDCSVDFEPAPVVTLSPYGNQTLTTAPGPYNVGVANSSLTAEAAPADITVTLLRKVVSECSGVLFSSNVTATISQGQMSTTYGFVAGRDPACNTLPITTTFTVTQAVMAPNITLDLSGVPAAQLSLSVVR